MSFSQNSFRLFSQLQSPDLENDSLDGSTSGIGLFSVDESAASA